MFKKVLIASLILTFSLVVQVFYTWPDYNLHLVFCDVGQGDGILIYQAFWQVLIDAGPDEAINGCLRHHIPFWDNQLEVVILTHPDSDHMGGMQTVFANYQVTQLFLADWETSQGFKNMVSAILEEQSPPGEIKAGFWQRQIVSSSGVKLDFLAPSQTTNSHSTETTLSDEIAAIQQLGQQNTKDKNYGSIVLLLNYNMFDLLLMGDAPQAIELALIQKGLINKIEGIKIGHHGSKFSTCQALLQITQPEFSVISCGNNNQYGHPSAEVLDRLRQTRSQVFRTDELGEIELITNGRCYWFAN
jgi:competence protein ComEC